MSGLIHGLYNGGPLPVQVDSAGRLVLTADVDIDTAGLATSAKQDTIIGHVDGLETAIASTNTKLDTAITALQVIDNIVGQEYETVAASQTAQVLGATGATGDLIRGLLIVPATVNAGQVLLLDNAISITVFPGGTASVNELRPFWVELGIRSVSGAWKVTTGADVSVIGVGDFTT